MVAIELTATNMLFFLVGFFSCACFILVLAISYVVFPHITEAKRFFNFYLKVKDKDRKK